MADSTVHKRETFIKILLYVMIIFYCSFLFVQCKEKLFFGEIDSYALPTISMQYRCSILMQQEDLEKAQKDYPNLYDGIDSYDKLRNSKLSITKDGKWESPYFPIYAFLCVPAKLVLQGLHLNQELAFGITNILCIIALLMAVMHTKKLMLMQKFLAVLLLAATPSFIYVQYISSEAMVFSFVGIGVLSFYEKKYKTGAVFITLAGLQNATVMAIGMVFIIDYYMNVLQSNKGERLWDIIKKELMPSIKFAFCFLPCFLPFILKKITGVKNFSPKAAVNEGAWSWFQRVLAYLFDLNLGYFSFAPILLMICIVVLFYAVYLKKYRAISLMAAFFGTIAAYSLMVHINCGMPYCSRYVYMTYPVLVVFMITIGYECINRKCLYICMNCFTIIISIFLLTFNTDTYYNSVELNQFSKLVLNNIPVLYHPLYSTFNSRISHVDGGYNYTTPVVYYDEDGYARKILAKKDDIEELRNSYVGNTDDTAWLEEEISALKSNAGYISIPKHRQIAHVENYEFGTDIHFSKGNYNADSYVAKGLSFQEDQFSWTDGDEVILRCRKKHQTDLIHAYIELALIYNEKQTVIILVDNKEVYRRVIAPGQNIEFNFKNPKDAPYIDIRILLPDVVSPEELGESSDERELGLAIKRMKFTDIGQSTFYEPGDDIMFYGNDYNADSYVVKGISYREEEWSWTEGHNLIIWCNLRNPAGPMHGFIELADVYNKQQEVEILVNGKQACQQIVKKGDHIEFDFENTEGASVAEIEVRLPDAVSPFALGESPDERMLALAIKRIVLMAGENGNK